MRAYDAVRSSWDLLTKHVNEPGCSEDAADLIMDISDPLGGAMDELYDAMGRSKPGNKREIVMRAKVLLDREFQELDPDPDRLLEVAKTVLSQPPSCGN